MKSVRWAAAVIGILVVAVVEAAGAVVAPFLFALLVGWANTRAV